MGSPDNSETLDDILIEQLRSEGFVCSLPSRAILFTEGETARGVHIISKGHIKLSISSCEGRVLILKVTKPGEILGLHNCITGAAYEMTAQTLQPSRVTFVKREDLMGVLRHSREACLSAVEQLGRICHMAYLEIGSLNLSRSVSENPKAADVAGINVYLVRYAAVITSGAFAGLAGAYLVADVGSFSEGMTSGRGC